MNRDIPPRERFILDTLWDIVNGQYPKIEGLTDHECKTLFMGGEIPGIHNPLLTTHSRHGSPGAASDGVKDDFRHAIERQTDGSASHVQ